MVGPEFYFSTVTADGKGLFKRATDTPIEGLIGGHYRFLNDFKAGLGIGPGFSHGFGTPELRVLGSFEWAPQPKKAAPPPPPPPKKLPPPPPPDRDGDGIVDAEDACPDVPGVVNADPTKNGCPADRDNDGVPDSEDRCPDVPGVKSNLGANVRPLDSDGDGIVDEQDACPNEAGIATNDPKTNGCPAPKGDRDNDGIKDDVDACPDEPGIATGDPKTNGCPQVVLVQGAIKILQQVKFASGKAKILADSNALLRSVANMLAMHAEIKHLRIEGHTDNVGKPEKNLTLSQARADSVRTWLVTEGGVDGERLTTKGYGQDKPIMPNNTDKGRKANRRVEFNIVDDLPDQAETLPAAPGK